MAQLTTIRAITEKKSHDRTHLRGGIILLVEFSERVAGHGVLASIVPALLIAIATTSYLEPRW